MKKLSYLLAGALLFIAPLAFAFDISLIVTCEKGADSNDNECDNYGYKSNPELFEPQNFSFNKDKLNNEYNIRDRVISLKQSKGVDTMESCGFITTGNEKIKCPLEDAIKYSNSYDVYLIVRFKLTTKTCSCDAMKVPFH